MEKKKLTAAVGMLSMNLMLMSTSTAGSAIAAIAKSFPREPISKVQLIGSIPQLGQIIATAFFSWLAFRFTRKNMGVISVAITAIAGLIPALYSNSLNLILACMVLLGFGTGVISNVVPVLIQENFDGEDRATVMGWSAGANNIGMMLFTFLGGMLGGTNWRNLFWVYGIGLIIFVIAYVLIPKDKKLDQSKTENSGNKESVFSLLKSLDPFVYFIYLITFFLSIAMMTFLANQSICLASQGKGTAYTATVIAVGNIGGIITAAVLTYIRKLTKNDTIAWGFIAFALSFACIIFSTNVVMHVLGNMFSGMGIVMVNATVPFELSTLADQKHFTVAISINTLVSSIAGMIVPLMLAAIKIQPGFNSFIFGICISIAVAAILFVTRFGNQIAKRAN
ncbi:MFS transporter [Lactobacillus sp. ESL0785]|uniref:MFS transporter n=1 Tax=Lactobacillus sp. ESL0785 TaxID=2983232 RepID=UPI0023F806AF|nr:MFS transporter [Lactobacillus sp. ESL0785]WEV70484.1 MFS transporter [Lactobacillus sp. ESL0785]